MTSFFAWNTRGFNKMRKHNLVSSWIKTTTPLFGCLLETRVQVENCSEIIHRVFPGWNFFTNYDHHRLGRIWMLWSEEVTVTPLYSGPQIITASVQTLSGMNFVVSCVYASNFQRDRILLWNEIKQIQDLFIRQDTPWAILGDFNQILEPDDHSRVQSFRGEHLGMREFQQLVFDCDLADLDYVGPRYTWWNHRYLDPIGKKLDRVLINEAWKASFPHSFAKFLTNGISDHTRSEVHLISYSRRKKSQFQFFNYLTEAPQFTEVISSVWSDTEPLYQSRYALHKFHKKLKALKPHLRTLNRERYGDISKRARDALLVLCEKQNQALTTPDSNAFAEVTEATANWNHLADIEERFFQQKSRISWLKNGDRNTPFFHRSVTTRASSNSIRRLIQENGKELIDPTDIKAEANEYFRSILQGSPIDEDNVTHSDWTRLITYRCSLQDSSRLTAPITEEEIKTTVFQLPSNKAPGPDGFTSEFFIACWPILGRDFTIAVQSFFTYGHMPKGVNATKLVLIPKKDGADSIRDFRPIACCNTIYKVISKLIANRLKNLLPEAI